MKFQQASADTNLHCLRPLTLQSFNLPDSACPAVLSPPVFVFCPTHPVQAAQVLDFVLISRCIIVDDCVLLIHTAGL